MHRSLVLESNALRLQSREHPDGWGLAYYADGVPRLARKPMAAFEDDDFANISQLVCSETVIAHVRRASVGTLNVQNTHPFAAGRWVMAHNGHLPGFQERRAQFEAPIEARLRRQMGGDTDSERYFALFLSALATRIGNLDAPDVGIASVASALEETLVHLEACCRSEPEAPALNVVVTNGSVFVAYRRGRPLYFSTHKSRCPDRHSCSVFDPDCCEAPAESGAPVNHLAVSSEPLGEGDVWREVGEDELIGVDASMRLHRRRIDVLPAELRPVTKGGIV